MKLTKKEQRAILETAETIHTEQIWDICPSLCILGSRDLPEKFAEFYGKDRLSPWWGYRFEYCFYPKDFATQCRAEKVLALLFFLEACK